MHQPTLADRGMKGGPAFRDPETLTDVAQSLVGCGAAGASLAAGVPIPPGMIEAAGAGASFFGRLLGERRRSVETVVDVFEPDLERRWRDRGAQSSNADDGARADALLNIEEVYNAAALPPDALAVVRLDPERTARDVLERAQAMRPNAYGALGSGTDAEHPDANVRPSRTFLLAHAGVVA